MMDRLKSCYHAFSFWAQRDGPRGRSPVMKYLVLISTAGALFMLILEAAIGTSSVSRSSSALLDGMSRP